MNKNIVIAFLVGVIITLVTVNYLPEIKFEQKEVVQTKTKPVIEEKKVLDNEPEKDIETSIFFAGQSVTEDELQSILAEKEDEVRGVSNIKEFLPPEDKYKDLERDQLSYSKPIEIKKPDDPFSLPNRPTPIKEPAIPGVDIPEAKRPEMSAESDETPDFGGPTFGAFAANTDDKALPVIKVPPQYPRRALQRCIEGWVLVEFTVTQIGSVTNPVVIDSLPPGIFNRSALRSIAKWKYKPRILDGKAVPRPGVQHLLTYEINDEAKCFAKAKKKGWID